jgi:cytoskeletal protein RodZ
MASRFSFGSRRSAEATSQQIYETARRNGGPATMGIGGVLRERREAMGVTLAEAEIATRIRQKYLAALESDEWQLLPGEVVGRGFLRNYATYLGLEPTEIIERRRAVAEPTLSAQLASTSAGSNLPPVRQVDYRPKEVDLRDEPDVMETRDLRLAPILATLAVVALAALLWFGRDTIGDTATGLVEAAQTSMAGFTAQTARPTPTVAASVAAGVVNPQNLDAAEGNAGDAAQAGAGATGQVAQTAGTGSAAVPGDIESAPAAAPESGSGAGEGGGSADAGSGASSEASIGGTSALAALIPTATPTPQAAAAEPAAEPTQEPTPVPPTPTPAPVEPTATPTEEPTPEPVVVPPVCPDSRSVIVSPGVGQIVSGALSVTGTATHEAFGYYKLEFAPGANAGGGFVFFAGGQNPVANGLLGNLDTTALGNGDYTILLTVVDATGNFPPPCSVSISIQN